MADTAIARRPGPGRRSAAIFALVAPVVGVAVGLYLLYWQPLAMVLLIASMAVGAVSIWYALTRRGPVRLLALVGVVFGICSVVNFGFALLFVEIAPLVAFALAGGYALGRYKQALVAGEEPARQTGAAKRGVLIINPKSGGGKAARWDLAGEGHRRGVQVITLEPGQDLTAIAEQAVADGADVIGMAGGDGSQALVATVAMRHKIAFVCVPSGTRNHFALDLGLDRKNVVAALDAFTDGFEREVDLGRVNDRVFVNNASLGVYARVVQSDAYRDAKLQTWLRTLPDILGPTAPPMNLEFDGPHGTHFAGAIMVLVSNNPYQMGQPGGGIATRPRLNNGQLGILAARVPGAAEITGGAFFRAIGQVRRFRDSSGILEWTQFDFEVHAAGPVPVGLDGETITLDPPLYFESLPGALRVRVPRQVAAKSPPKPNAALTRNDITALFHVASGRPYPRAELVDQGVTDVS